MKFQHLGEAMRYLVTEHSASILTKKTFLSMLYDIVPERADEIQLIGFVMNGSIVNSLLQQDPKTKDTRSAALATMVQRMIDERHLQPETAQQIANYYAYALGWETTAYESNSSAPAKRSSNPPDNASPVPAGRYGTPKVKQMLPVVLILFLLLAGLITLILLTRKQPKPLAPAIDTLVVPVTEETTPPTEATIPETQPIETAAPTALVTQPATEAPIPTEPPRTEPPVTEPPVTEKAVAAFPGQAFLAIANSNWSIIYWGESDDPLAYNAGVVDITGNGSYVVSVTTDTNAFRNSDKGQYYTNNNMVEGIDYMAVSIENGDAICPGATITIDRIFVDGLEIKMIARNVTDYDGDNIIGTIYGFSTSEAWSIEGPLWTIENHDSIFSAKIINPVYFEEWTTVEVHFTVSGMDS